MDPEGGGMLTITASVAMIPSLMIDSWSITVKSNFHFPHKNQS